MLRAWRDFYVGNRLSLKRRQESVKRQQGEGKDMVPERPPDSVIMFGLGMGINSWTMAAGVGDSE